MDPITMALISGGAGLAKGIFGAIQGIGGAQKQKQLWNNRPQLGVTAGETANNQLYNQMASASSMPGQQQYEDKLGQTYSQGVSDINKTAISSLGATQGAVDLAGKKMQAVQDLSGAFAEYKQKNIERLGSWNNQKSQNEMQRFSVNQLQPWEIKMNEAVSQKQNGFQAFGSGIDTGMGVFGDYAGTQSMLDILKKMGGNTGGGGG